MYRHIHRVLRRENSLPSVHKIEGVCLVEVYIFYLNENKVTQVFAPVIVFIIYQFCQHPERERQGHHWGLDERFLCKISSKNEKVSDWTNKILVREKHLPRYMICVFIKTVCLQDKGSCNTALDTHEVTQIVEIKTDNFCNSLLSITQVI